MAKFRPGFWVKRHGYSGETSYRDFDTYPECLREAKKLLKSGELTEIHIFRSKRGEWGEWFEIWELQGGKPVKKKEGWN